MEKIDLDLIQSDQTTDKKVLEVYEYLKAYKDCKERTDWLDRRKKWGWDIVENIIWDSDEEKAMKDEGQIPFPINKCVEGIRGSSAILTAQNPGLNFNPIGSGDLYIAELFKRGFDLVWDMNEGSDINYDVVEEVEVGGHGWFNVRLDKSKSPFGSIVIEEDDPEDIYFDKNARKRDYSDTHIIKAKLRSRAYIKEEYPEIADKDLYFSPTSKEDDEKSSGVTGEDNYTIDASADSISAEIKSKQKVIWEIEAKMRRIVKEDWVAWIDEGNQLQTAKLEPGADISSLPEGRKHWPRKVLKREYLVIVGKKIVSSQMNPHGEDSDGDPVLNLIGLKGQRTRSAYAMSKTNYAGPINKEKAKRRIQTIHAASHLINSPLYFWEGTEWSGHPGTPGSHAKLSINNPNPPGRVSSGAVDVMQLVRLEEKADQEIQDIYEVQEVDKGKPPKGNEKVGWQTVSLLQQGSSTMSGPSRRRMESALVRLAKVVVSMMLKHWQRYMWERLLEDEERFNFAPEGTQEFKQKQEFAEEGQAPSQEDPMEEVRQKIAAKWEAALEKIRPKDFSQPPGMSLIDIDVKITAGSSMPTNRIAKGQMAIEYVKSGIFDAEAALEYIDDPNKEKIVERLKRKAESEQQAAMMK